MKRILMLLAMGASIGLLQETTNAGALNLSVDLNGVVIFTTTSTSPDQSISANLVSVNSALTASGSAYQFSTLGAQSNFAGSSVGTLTTSALLNTMGSGTTAAVLSIDVTQSGFTAPIGANGQITSSAGGSYAGANGSLSFTSDFQGANTPTLVFPVSGSNSFSGATGPVPVGTIPSGYEISNHFLISLAKSPNVSLGLTGTAVVSGGTVPEPVSIALLGLGAIAVLTRRRPA